MTNEEIKLIISTFLFLITQLTKEAFPYFMEKYGKWVVIVLGLIGATISVVGFLSTNTPLVVANQWEAVLIILREVAVGLVIGFSAVGIYQAANVLAPSVVRSSDAILVDKTPVAISGEVTVSVPVVGTKVETIEVKSPTVEDAKELEVIKVPEIKEYKSKTPK